MGRGFEKFVSGISEGYGLGEKVGGDIQRGRSKRGVEKYSNELREHLNKDPLAVSQGIDDGTSTAPTTRDIMAIQNDYRKYAEMSGDPNAADRAMDMWAKDLHQGATSNLTKAAEALESGDMESAAKLIEHAGTFVPDGNAYKTKRGDDGSLLVAAYDEKTGK